MIYQNYIEADYRNRSVRMRKRAKEGGTIRFYEGEAAALDRLKALRAEGLGFDRIAARMTEEAPPTLTGRPRLGVVVNRILTRTR
jgi:hypothetical protein